MDAWPGEYKLGDAKTDDKGKGKATAKAQPRILHHPELEHGTMQAATLQDHDGKLEWNFIQNQNWRGRSQIHPVANPAIVFPSTRPPPLKIPRTTIRQQAEQGANFLRTYYPDMDLTQELIREEIKADAQNIRQSEVYDPFKGNLLKPILQYDGGSKKMAFLAFPMGELNKELNISPFYYSKATGSVFKPSGRRTRTFSTPIQQIVASNPVFGVGQQDTYLAIRTYGSTSLFRFKSSTMRNFSEDSVLTDVVDLTGSDFGNEAVVDLVLQSNCQTVAVTEAGSLYQFDPFMGSPKKLGFRFEVPIPDSFWRVAHGMKRNTWLLAYNQGVKLFDSRTNTTASDLVSLGNHAEMVASIEGTQDDHILRVATTSQLVWIDERSPVRPLFGFRHQRQFDRGLRVDTVKIQGGPLTFLSSPRNNLVSVYDVSRDKNQILQVKQRPYCLPAISSAEAFSLGCTFFRHPLVTDHKDISLFGLSPRGCIHHVGLSLSDSCQDTPDNVTNFQWSDEVAALDSQAAELTAYAGSLSAREFSELDFRGAYESLFKSHFDADDDIDAESFYDVLEAMPSFWQRDTATAEHILTTFDVAFRTGDEPLKVSRADFLTQSAVNSKRGFRALAQEGLPPRRLATTAKWCCSLNSTFERMDPVLLDEEPYFNRFRKFSLVDDLQRSTVTMKRENEAREQLVLDLALSTDIYSAFPFAKESQQGNEFESIERATEALSLAGEPPLVDYGFLRPNPGDVGHGSDRSEVETLGVRLLLKEWVVGTDPECYGYVDPYDASVADASHPIVQRTIYQPSQPTTAGVQPLRPPVVVASKDLPPPRDMSTRRAPLASQSFGRLAVSGSQPQFPSSQSSSQAIQECMSSTQPLPGPFGARPSAVKKKAVKKRLGGF